VPPEGTRTRSRLGSHDRSGTSYASKSVVAPARHARHSSAEPLTCLASRSHEAYTADRQSIRDCALLPSDLEPHLGGDGLWTTDVLVPAGGESNIAGLVGTCPRGECQCLEFYIFIFIMYSCYMMYMLMMKGLPTLTSGDELMWSFHRHDTRHDSCALITMSC
jgi:hypothetical protein